MKRWRGFTMIEMLVVLALVAVLAAGARPLLELQHRRQQELALRDGLRQLRSAIDAYKRAADNKLIEQRPGDSGWPPNLEVLVQGVALAASAAEPGAADEVRRLYLLRRLPRDPFADPELAARDTWALRGSQSPPEAPRPGRDVFDVASMSERRALDGTVYKDW